MDRFQPGDRFGDLEIQRELARGSYGTVYLAWDKLIGRRVALKWVHPSASAAHAQDLERMLNEARLVGRLKSPHIATLYRVHALERDQGWLFEMEYVEGGSLQDLLGVDRRLAPEEARRIARGILTGLEHAHEAGIVHGDMKPGNVLLTRDRTVKLVDFGLSRLVGEASVSTSGVELAGTPLYMAPEVVMGERPDVSSDLWSVGVVLYRMLAGRTPFPGRTLPTLFYAIHNSTPHRLDPALPPALVDLATRCLAKLPQGRPASCQAALGELAPAAAAADGPPTPVPPIAKGPRLFGRAAELEQLRAAVRDVADGRGRTVLLSGETGAGKSMLAHEGLTYAARLQFRCAEARVTALQGLLRPLLGGVRELLSPAAVADADQRLIESQLFGTATGLLRELLETKAPIRLGSLQQMLWALEQLLTGLAAPRPLAICVEDVHLAHAEDQELLAEVARRLEASRVLLLIVYRSTDPEGSTTAEAQLALRPLVGHENAVHIHLEPLAPDAVSRLLHDRAGEAQLTPEVLQHILTVAQGNPLFTIELFHHLERSGAVVRKGNRIGPGPGWAHLKLPDRLRELVTLELQGLPEDQRKVLDVAAVDGVEFDGEAAAAVLDRPLLEVLRTLQQIYRRTGLVVPQARGHRFANAVIQEGIYEDLAPDLRRAIHESLAAHLERQAASREVLPERLGQHWERAGQPDKARPHLCRAAHEATLRQDLLRAIDFTRRAGLAPDQLDAAQAAENTELLLDVSGAYAARGRFEESDKIFDVLLEVAEQAHDEILQAQVLVRRDHQRYRQRGLEGVNEAGLRRAAELLPPSEHKGRAYYLLGIILKYRGDLEEAVRHFRAADEQFVECGHLGLHSSALDQLGSVSLRRGRWHEAEALYADASRISAAAGRHTNAAVSEINGVSAAYHGGALDGLDERLERSIRTLAREGASTQGAAARELLGQVLYAQGDSQGAQAQVDEALAILERAQHVGGLMAASVLRADLLIITGFLDRARETLSEVRRLAGLREDYRCLAEVALHDCHIACFLGERDRAQAAAEESLQWIRRGGQDAVASETIFLTMAEAVVYGLSPTALKEVETSLYQVRPKDAALTQRSLRVCRGARALCNPAGAPEQLMEAAAALRAPDLGPRRAVLRVVGARLAAEARHRATQESEARREAETGLADAVALRHIWLELHLRAFLARHGHGAELLAERRHELAERLASADERRRFLEAWDA
ncbi:MAG: serine/threonine-protein kinase [Planctomycetota bacterium]